VLEVGYFYYNSSRVLGLPFGLKENSTPNKSKITSIFLIPTSSIKPFSIFEIVRFVIPNFIS
jgi:hypothetical protein